MYSAKVELDGLKEEKRNALRLIEELRDDKDRLVDRLKDTEMQLSRTGIDSEKNRAMLVEQSARLEEYRIDNMSMKHEKEKLYHKIELLTEESNNLRNEVYMMKKLLLEYDKREIQMVGSATKPSMPQSLASPTFQNEPSSQTRDKTLDRLTPPRDRPQRGAVPTFPVDKSRAEAMVSPGKNRSFLSPGRNAGSVPNPLTWGQPYDSRLKC